MAMARSGRDTRLELTLIRAPRAMQKGVNLANRGIGRTQNSVRRDWLRTGRSTYIAHCPLRSQETISSTLKTPTG
jgi:hypothetical protein